MHKLFFRTASFLAMISVVIGAFGTHVMKDVLSAADFDSIKTATYYQMVHSFAIFVTGMLYRHYPGKKMEYAGYLFVAGILFFSGSIYLIRILAYLQISVGGFVFILTPIGGLLLILGWLMLGSAIPAEHAYLSRKSSSKDDNA